MGQASEIMSVATHVGINVEAAQKFGLKITTEDLNETTKDSEVNEDAGDNADFKSTLYLAYNVVNYSFYPENGENRWFTFDDDKKKFVGKDDEAHAIVLCLTRYQRINKKGLTDPDALRALTLKDVIILLFI